MITAGLLLFAWTFLLALSGWSRFDDLMDELARILDLEPPDRERG
jgi:hypothetical protein